MNILGNALREALELDWRTTVGKVSVRLNEVDFQCVYI